MKSFIVRFVSVLLFFMTLWLETGWAILQYQHLPAEANSVTGASFVVEPLCDSAGTFGKPIDLFCLITRKNVEKRAIVESVSVQAKQSIVLRSSFGSRAECLSLTQFEYQYTNYVSERRSSGYFLYAQGRLLI